MKNQAREYIGHDEVINFAEVYFNVEENGSLNITILTKKSMARGLTTTRPYAVYFFIKVCFF